MDDFNTQLAELKARYKEAVYRESCIREMAFLPDCQEICGIPVRQFTPYHYMLLDFVKSPFVSGNETPDDGRIAEFLWVVSKEYKDNDPEGKDKFIKEKCKDIDYAQCYMDIKEYISEALIDVPPVQFKPNTKGEPTVPYFAWVVTYIDTLANAYGWDDDKIIHMPFARILQYTKAIEARAWIASGQEPLLFNGSDKVRNEIRRLIKKQRETQ